MSMPDRRLNTVLSRTSLSRSTIYRKIAKGTFPAQIRISVNGAGWQTDIAILDRTDDAGSRLSSSELYCRRRGARRDASCGEPPDRPP
ncbi:helix-turn-helix transcriptional regulator [Rhizobium mesoamericanum]|uniref:helix-turn-helix transcriptional regulator n=1 Tax=Rhizobium mesoamericanum TaxID=1079800 RepID=UPI0027D89815|nr:AlpA family phage regulatory protein [Rhizobium mesoamericanum]